MNRVLRSCLLATAVVAASCNCSKSRPHSEREDNPHVVLGDAGAALVRPKPFLCEPSAGGEVFTLGSTNGADEDDDSGLDIPFAINVGDGLALEGGFAVTAVDGRGSRTQAILGLMSTDAQRSRKIDLGRVYGDADPPRVAGNAERLVLAMADMDAGGRTLSLARVDAPLKQPTVTRGSDVSVAGSPSTLFSLALNGNQGVLIWDQEERSSDFSEVALVPFLVQSLTLVGRPLVVSGKRVSADSPRVMSRPGGFWVVWVQAGAEVAPAGKSANGKVAQKFSGSPNDDNLNPVDMGTRELRALTLDTSGHPLGKPLRVAEGESHVVAYDVGLLDDGAALLAWRDDDTTPGVESQIVRLARVGIDGHVDFYRTEDETIGVGAPQLLVDTSVPPQDRVWLALVNTGERTSIIKLLPNGRPTGLIVGDAELGVANPLLRHQGRLLLVRQRGKGVDMEAIHCSLTAEGQPPG